MDNNFYEAISQLNDSLYGVLSKLPNELTSKITEIRLRAFNPIVLKTAKNNYFIKRDGTVLNMNGELVFTVTPVDISSSINKMCSYSIYSYQDQIRNGYITIKGGHRVGICGTAVFDDSKLINIKNITSMNIRIARNIDIYNDKIIKLLKNDFKGIVLVGPPNSGKTTLLRYIAKVLSLDLSNVSVIDERMELALNFKNSDLGFCDILSGYTKSDGIIKAIRALSPEFIVCDEIGDIKDIKALQYGVNAGVKFIVSIHAKDLNELLMRPQGKMLLDTNAFDKIIFLDNKYNPGKVIDIISWKASLKDEKVLLNNFRKTESMYFKNNQIC